MTKLAKVEVFPEAPKHCRLGRPKKSFDHAKLDALAVAAPESPGELLTQLFILDARMLDRETQHELLRIFPQLIHVRRAWKAHFLEHGCLLCRNGRRLDPTRHIAANLRRMGMSWSDIFKALTIDEELTPRDRKLICTSVYAILRRRAKGVTRSKPGKSQEPTWYGSGGFCDACQAVVLHRMLKRYRQSVEGRDLPAEAEAFKDALCLKYNAAQRLFNGEE
jgi:hypothetical protein